MGIRLSKLVGLDGPYVHEGPLPSHDHCGYEVAVQMLLYSKRPGNNVKSHLQFETVRKLCTSYSNHVRASPQSNAESMSMGDVKGNYQRLTNDPCGSLWFYKFIKGAKSRMGQEWRPNKGLSTKLYLKVLADVELRIQGAASVRELNRWVVFHTYAVVCYVLSLRGSEGLLLDLDGLHRHWGTGDGTYVVVTLQGTIKGESNDRDHLLPCVPVTSSGVDVKVSLERLMALKARKGFLDGPAISDLDGRVYSTRDMSDSLAEVIEDLFETDRSLFPADILTKEVLRERYQAFRTFRRTSDTRAAEMNVGATDTDIVNRWQLVEGAKGRRAAMPMRLHYTQIDIILKPFLRYTWLM
jgi:hypothetical protein